jgi:predicted ABC-type ATPase
MKRLDLVVGPNGAGKSTFVAVTLAPLLPGSVFVNADEIAKARCPDDMPAHAYDAAGIAAETRGVLIAEGRSFIAETVFSHPSKLELIDAAHEAGYIVALHVLLIPENLAVQRVAYRVYAGGHDVPTDKIRDRYQRLWHLVAEAMCRCALTTAYDNAHRSGPRIVARLDNGFAVGESTWPKHTPEILTARWPR